MKRTAYIVIVVLLTKLAVAQSPSPARKQANSILLINGTAHIGDGSVIKNSAIGFTNGKFDYIGMSNASDIDKSKYEVINIEGKHVYPGFILPNSDVGLKEVMAVRATLDHTETGDLNPNIRSITSFNTDSEIIPTLRFNGILTAQVTPNGGIISGMSSIVQLDAWNWEDAAVKIDDGIHLDWPSKTLRARWWLGEKEARPNEDYDKTVKELNKIFTDAIAYDKSNGLSKNIKLEAMAGLFDGSKQLFIHEDKAVDIITSIEFAKEVGVKKIVLVGGGDALYVKEFLKQNDIAVILSNVHRLPSRAEDDVDLPYKLPYLLGKFGIKYCLGYTSDMANMRNLPFFAGTTVAYGVDKEMALKSITLDAAEILGVENVLGSLSIDKNATFFISEGDALDMRTNNLNSAYIDGRKVMLNAMQQRLYQKYKAKYDQN